MLLVILTIFTLNGCSTNKSISEDAFKVMCSEYELAICDDFEGDDYHERSIEDIQAYAKYLFQFKYVYTSDPDDGKDHYDYMDDYPMKGDCEDLVITFLENLVVHGMVNDTEWVFGTVNGITHAWLLITVNEDTYLFDTYNRYGVNILSTTGYAKEFTIYKVKD